MQLPSESAVTLRDDWDVNDLASYLRRSQRSRITVVVSVPQQQAKPPVDVGELKRRLGAKADVVVVPAALTFKLTDALGRTGSVFGGAARMYPCDDGWLSDQYRTELIIRRARRTRCSARSSGPWPTSCAAWTSANGGVARRRRHRHILFRRARHPPPIRRRPHSRRRHAPLPPKPGLREPAERGAPGREPPERCPPKQGPQTQEPQSVFCQLGVCRLTVGKLTGLPVVMLPVCRGWACPVGGFWVIA